jgi:hypothetical protein
VITSRISSRTHAKIDLGVSAAFAGLALWPQVPRRARAALGAAAAYHASYSAVTDYEGGVVGRIDMPRHLALDLLGAAGLCLSGLLAAPGEGRRLLLAAGAAELTVLALSDRRARAGPPETAYPPLDVPKPVADDLWVVDGVLGPGVPVRMTVVRLRNGDLLLHSPTRYDDGLRRALERLGRITHLVAPNIAHWTFMKSWQDAVPSAQVWAAPGLRRRGQVRRSGLLINHDLAEQAPAEWAEEIEQVVVRGGGGFTEVAMLHRPSRTLLLTDLVQNFEPEKLPWLLRPIAALLGNTAPSGRAPAYLRGVVQLNGRQAATAARRIVEWAPRRVLVTHGHAFERDAAGQLRRSLAWLTQN